MSPHSASLPLRTPATAFLMRGGRATVPRAFPQSHLPMLAPRGALYEPPLRPFRDFCGGSYGSDFRPFAVPPCCCLLLHRLRWLDARSVVFCLPRMPLPTCSHPISNPVGISPTERPRLALNHQSSRTRLDADSVSLFRVSRPEIPKQLAYMNPRNTHHPLEGRPGPSTAWSFK